MLKAATEKDLDAILEFCDGDLLGTRIGCYCLAYGFDRDFLRVWTDDGDGKISTVITKFYDCITIKTALSAVDEIGDFISMIGFKSLEATLDACEKLGLKADTVKKSYVFRGEVENNMGATDLGEEYFRELYSLVCENIPGSFENTKEAYLSFLSDFTFRNHRNLARSKGIISDGRLVSCVITSAETDKSALLSAVASDKNVRGSGFGKKTVLTAVNELKKESKEVFVIALNESAESFYEHIGFEYYTDICYIERK